MHLEQVTHGEKHLLFFRDHEKYGDKFYRVEKSKGQDETWLLTPEDFDRFVKSCPLDTLVDVIEVVANQPPSK
jgi:hypothetical protein